MSGRLVMRGVVNPVVRRVLASPVHDLLGPRVGVLTMTGRRSGREVRVPVNLLEDGDGLVVLSRRDRRWWRNVRGGAPVGVLREGHELRGHGDVDRDVTRDEVAALVARAYAEAGHPVSGDRARERARDRVVVRIALQPSAAVTPLPLRGGRLWRRWTATVTAGEALAFAIPATAGALLAAADAPPGVLVPVTLAAGGAEGAVLGLAQALVLRRALPGVRSRTWVRATVAGALCAWAIGVLPFVAGSWVEDRGTGLQVVLLAVLGGALLCALGAFQWRELRRHVAGAGLWVPATATAWLVALGVFMAIASPLWHEGQPTALVVAIGIAAGAAMAATAAAVTGAALVSLLGQGHEAGAAREGTAAAPHEAA